MSQHQPNLLRVIQLLLDVRDDPQGLDVMARVSGTFANSPLLD